MNIITLIQENSPIYSFDVKHGSIAYVVQNQKGTWVGPLQNHEKELKVTIVFENAKGKNSYDIIRLYLTNLSTYNSKIAFQTKCTC